MSSRPTSDVSPGATTSTVRLWTGGRRRAAPWLLHRFKLGELGTPCSPHHTPGPHSLDLFCRAIPRMFHEKELIFVRRVIGIKYKPFLSLCIVLVDV